MKKLFFSILVLACAFCVVFGMTSCEKIPETELPGTDANQTEETTNTPEPDQKVTYTVTVTCEDSVTLATVTVKLVNDQGEATEAKSLTNGKASFELKAGTYKVVLAGALDRYDLPETPTVLTPTANSVVIPLVLKTEEPPQPVEVGFNFKVTMPNGAPVADLDVLVCGTAEGSACTPGKTNAEGVAAFKLETGTYVVHVEAAAWPENCFFDNDGTVITVAEDTKEVVVSFESACVYEIYVTDDQTRESLADMNVCLTLISEDGRSLTVTGKTDAEGKASILAPVGAYSITITNLSETQAVMYSSVEAYYYEGELYFDGGYVSVMKKGSTPYAPIDVDVNATTTVTLAPFDKVYYSFNYNGVPGLYKITVTGTGEMTVEIYEGTEGYINYMPTKSKTDVNVTLEFEIAPEYAEGGNQYIVAINRADLEEDVKTVSFVITREGDIPETVIHEFDVEAKEIKAEQPAIPAETNFTFADIFGEDIVLCEDGYYHINDQAGPIVYVTIAGSKYYPRGFDTTMAGAYAESNGIGFGRSEMISKYEYNNYDYGKLIAAYIAAVNEDGLYPLTSEMKDFLQWYAVSSHATDVLGWELTDWEGNVNPNLYYFACGYYKNLYGTSEGTGTAEDPVCIFMPGSYKITVPAGTMHFAISVKGMEEYALSLVSGDAILYDENGDNAFGSIVINNGYATFTLVAEAQTEVVLELGAVVTIPRGPISESGNYKVFASKEGTELYIYAAVAGEYTLSTSDPNAFLVRVETYGEGEFATTYEMSVMGGSFYLEEGETALIKCISWIGDTSYVITLEAPSEDDTEGAIEVYLGETTLQVNGFGTKVVFTAPETGYYSFTSESANAYIFGNDDFASLLTDPVPLWEGERYVFFCGTENMMDETYTLKIEAFEEPTNETVLNLGENTLQVNGFGAKYVFTATEKGTYSITAESENAYLFVDNDFGSEEISGIVTLEEGESYTFFCGTVNFEDDTYVVVITLLPKGLDVSEDTEEGWNELRPIC